MLNDVLKTQIGCKLLNTVSRRLTVLGADLLGFYNINPSTCESFQIFVQLKSSETAILKQHKTCISKICGCCRLVHGT